MRTDVSENMQPYVIIVEDDERLADLTAEYLRSNGIRVDVIHDGSVATLKEAVRYMAGGGKPDPNKTPLMRPTGLNDAEIEKIVAFWRA